MYFKYALDVCELIFVSNYGVLVRYWRRF